MANQFFNVDKETLTTTINQVDAINLSNQYRYTNTSGLAVGGTAGDYVLAVFTIPANTIGSALGQLQEFVVQANGSFGATANNKRVKLIWNPSAAVVGSAVTGGTVIADTGTVATNGSGFSLAGAVIRSAANAQVLTNLGSIAGTVALGTAAPASASATETGDILIAVTGNATTATTDIKLNYFKVDGMA